MHSLNHPIACGSPSLRRPVTQGDYPAADRNRRPQTTLHDGSAGRPQPRASAAMHSILLPRRHLRHRRLCDQLSGLRALCAATRWRHGPEVLSAVVRGSDAPPAYHAQHQPWDRCASAAASRHVASIVLSWARPVPSSTSASLQRRSLGVASRELRREPSHASRRRVAAVASAVQSGPSHGKVIPRRSCSPRSMSGKSQACSSTIGGCARCDLRQPVGGQHSRQRKRRLQNAAASNS